MSAKKKFRVTLAREVRDLEVTTVVVEAEDEDAAAEAAVKLVEPEDPPDDWQGWEWNPDKRLECEDAQVEEVEEVPADTPLTEEG